LITTQTMSSCNQESTNFENNYYRDDYDSPEWWSKDQISITWDPITGKYTYYNRNTQRSYNDPDKALFDEELPILENDNIYLDRGIRNYQQITALYNPGTDHFWYYNQHTRKSSYTLKQSVLTQKQYFTPSPGLGMMCDPEYMVDDEFNLEEMDKYYGQKAQKLDEAYADYLSDW